MATDLRGSVPAQFISEFDKSGLRLPKLTKNQSGALLVRDVDAH